MKAKYAFFMLLLFFLTSCAKKTDNQSGNADSSLIKISHAQFSANDMQIGTLQPVTWQDGILCKAVVQAQPTGVATVSSPVAGVVKSINVVAGDLVRKGQALCSVSGTVFLTLQQEFAEAAVQYKLNKKEYERAKTLYAQNIGSDKEFTQIESNYKMSRAKYEMLRQKIRLLHLSETKIENGQFYESFHIVSPINGSVSKADIAIGKSIDDISALYEIVDQSKLMLSLQVFESDANKIKEGQRVEFRLTADTAAVLMAKIQKVGKSVDMENKSVLCMAVIDSQHGSLLNNSFADAQIFVGEKTIQALPTDAVVRVGNEDYVLCLVKEDANNYYFAKKMVVAGKTANSKTEILKGISTEKVLVKGAFNLILE